jgi:hypothetical protein
MRAGEHLDDQATDAAEAHDSDAEPFERLLAAVAEHAGLPVPFGIGGGSGCGARLEPDEVVARDDDLGDGTRDRRRAARGRRPLPAR